MQQQAWDNSPIVFMLQQKNVAFARKNVVGFHLGRQSADAEDLTGWFD
ncbi:MAG TPA: hypothetical protein VFW75_17795 [Acetobacteraceae bacterium]|nr:hypothetical protein [Acetobacteraceae bacterium]